jgi:phosphocarrier protein HPr
MVIEQLSLNNGSGLHARPASDFVREASKFSSDILIRNINIASAWVNAKSILSILTLGVENNHTVEIKVDGSDEVEAAHALVGMVNQFNMNHE